MYKLRAFIVLFGFIFLLSACVPISEEETQKGEELVAKYRSIIEDFVREQDGEKAKILEMRARESYLFNSVWGTPEERVLSPELSIQVDIKKGFAKYGYLYRSNDGTYSTDKYAEDIITSLQTKFENSLGYDVTSIKASYIGDYLNRYVDYNIRTAEDLLATKAEIRIHIYLEKANLGEIAKNKEIIDLIHDADIDLFFINKLSRYTWRDKKTLRFGDKLEYPSGGVKEYEDGTRLPYNSELENKKLEFLYMYKEKATEELLMIEYNNDKIVNKY